jgi:hypothetical protein
MRIPDAGIPDNWEFTEFKIQSVKYYVGQKLASVKR